MNQSDLEDRFAFLGFTSQERSTLRTLTPVVQSQLPAILDQFYRDIAAQPEVDAMFASQEMRDHAREKQLEHWLLICLGTFDRSYLDSVQRIGEAHARLGLKPAWYFGGYSKIVSGLIRAIAAQRDSSSFLKSSKPQSKTDMADQLVVLNKAALLDMDLCISTIEECAAQKAQRERDNLANRFETSVSEVANTISDASEKLVSVARSLQVTASGTTEQSASVAAAAEEASVTAHAVASAAGQLTVGIREVAVSSTKSAELSSKAQSRAEQTQGTINNLAEAAQKIGEIVSMIEAIAGQTNLLALNATIEAARAGESGKGFAVVAGEVKALAAQTSSATDEISGQISKIQSVVGEAVGAIEEIATSISDVSMAATEISSAVEEQNAASGEISRNTEQTASSADMVADTISKVQQNADETSRASGVVVDAADALGQQADRLRKDVDAFLNHVRSAA